MPKSTEKQGTIDTTWEIWTYDVWGNANDGYEVNDRSCLNRKCPLSLKVEKYNYGTPNEFESASPSDSQIRSIFGIGKTRIETDGDDVHIYVTRRKDEYPIGEMLCISHNSLSPIEII